MLMEATVSMAMPNRISRLVLILCWFAILSEGYDQGAIGTILPSLAVAPRWHLSQIQLGALGSAALVGTFSGACVIGLCSDLAGRKALFFSCLALFASSVVVAPWSPTPKLFALARVIRGIGLGGIIPIAAALTVEYSPADTGNLSFVIMYTGYPLGTVFSVVAGIA